jgi:hypothetical protein
MSNAMYGKGLEAFLEGSIAALTDTLSLSLVTTAYSPNLSTDQWYSTVVASGGVTAGPINLTTVTGAAGSLSADNVIFPSVSGAASNYLVLFKNTGVAGTSPLIARYDTATGLPVTPNGGNITVAWSGGVLFTLLEDIEAKADARDKARVRSRIRRLIRAFGFDQSPGGVWLPAPSLGFEGI